MSDGERRIEAAKQAVDDANAEYRRVLMEVRGRCEKSNDEGGQCVQPAGHVGAHRNVEVIWYEVFGGR